VPILTGVVSGVGGALANKSRKSTSTSTQNYSRTPTLTPEMKSIQDQLVAYFQQSMQPEGSAALQRLKTNAQSKVASNYKTAPATAANELAARGFATGKSGLSQRTMDQAALSKYSALGDLEGTFAQAILGQNQQGASALMSLLNANRGEEGTSTTTGEAVQGGNMLGGGLNAGVETVILLSTLDKLMKRGGANAAPSSAMPTSNFVQNPFSWISGGG
jgi:hypothetical protein